MFLSGSEQIYSDFSSQWRWAPSARTNDIFRQSFAKGQGGVMDNQDLGMTSPDSSLSHCVTPGQTDKNSEILPVFSHSSTVPPTPYLSSWEDQSFWLIFLTWLRGPLGGYGRKGTHFRSVKLTLATKRVVDVPVGQLPIRQARSMSNQGPLDGGGDIKIGSVIKEKIDGFDQKRGEKNTKMSKEPQSVLPTRWRIDDDGLWRGQLKDRWEHTWLDSLMKA